MADGVKGLIFHLRRYLSIEPSRYSNIGPSNAITRELLKYHCSLKHLTTDFLTKFGDLRYNTI